MSMTFIHSPLRLLLSLCLGAILLGATLAFPPAPFYTIYGTVRDEIGNVLTAADAQIVLIKGAEVVLKAPVTGTTRADQNYELRIPIDMLRPSTTIYREEAVIARNGFTMAVEFGGQRYYPLAVAGSLTAGGGSERDRFDFTIGADSDGDGLPDLWEEYQLSLCNIPPGPNGYDLTLLSRNGDIDKDGQTDYAEYIAGTYACDGKDYISLTIFEKKPGQAKLSFKSVPGKSYKIQRTTNLFTWATVPYSVGVPGFPNEVFVATDVDQIVAYVVPESEAREFYRLIAQ